MRRSSGEGHRSREGKLFRWDLRVGGERVVRKANTKAELDRRVETVLADLRIKGLLNVDAEYLNFGETFCQYLEMEIRPQSSPRTYESYEGIYRNHLSIFAKTRLNAVQTRSLQYLSDALRDAGKLRTAEYVILVASRFFNWCVRHELAQRNPTIAVKKPRLDTPSTRVMTNQELAKVMGEARRRFEEGSWRCYPVLLFCLNTGVRISEALALRTEDLRTENGIVRADIEGQIFQKQQRWTIRPAKCGSSRTIVLNDAAQDAIRISAETVPTDKQRAREAYNDHRFLFPNETGGPMLACVAYRAFIRLQKSLKITEPFTVHELRHTYLTHIARFHPLQVVKKIAGHSSLRTTERYVKTLDEDVVQAMQRVVGPH